MPETLKVADAGANKRERYETLLVQLESLLDGSEPSLVANLANCCAALQQTFKWWWVGFYLVDKNNNNKVNKQGCTEEQLVLGPFQGPIACTRIKFGKGVCGTSWMRKETLVVPDVEKFPGHIACSSESKSEIVCPIFAVDKTVVAVLDVDSEHLEHFDDVDKSMLGRLCDILGRNLNWTN